MTLENLKNLEASRYLSNLKSLEVNLNKFGLKVKLIGNKSLFTEEIYLKK